MMPRRLHTASFEEIQAGEVSDVYFLRSKEILSARKMGQRVVAEFVVKGFPPELGWGIFAGLEELLSLAEGLPVSIQAVPEGTIFYPHDPVLVIEGRYLDFAIYETAMLGFLCQASGIATRAARYRLAAGKKTLLSFGARRMHPVIAPMIERNAYVGGCDGVAVLKSAELLHIAPSGTIPHALILLFGDTVRAVQAFDDVIDEEIKRIALVDTFQDEKFETLRVAESLGKRLYGVRFDTPGSRRGDLLEIIRETRWELNLRGLGHVKIFVSGGLDETSITRLQKDVDGFGVGTSLSNAPVLDYSMDIVQIENQPIAKRGKMSGKKDLFRCARCLRTVVLPTGRVPDSDCSCGGKYEPILQPVLQEGHLVTSLPSPSEIRTYVLDQLGKLFP